MNNIINTLQDIRGFFDNKRLANPTHEDKSSVKLGHSMTTKVNRSIYFRSPTEPPDNKSDSTAIRKSFSNISSFVNSGTLKQVNLNYMVNFMDLLLQKFKTDLSFHIANSGAISRLQSEPIPANRPELHLIKNLIDFECFTIHNKKEKPYFYKAESIVERYKLMVATLEEGLKSLRKENLMKLIAFFDENEFQKSLMKYFAPNLFEHQYFRIVCSELFRFMRSSKLSEASQQNIQASFENLKLFLYGISFPSPYVEDYPLHQAVFTSNLPMIRRICAREKSPVFYAHIEQSDPVGVTPLMLAVLLGNKDAALILTNHGAHPKHRSYPYVRTPLEEAVFRKNRSMVKLLLLARINIKQANWEENKQHLIEFLRKIPDFSFEMNWECDSKIIPFVKKVTPSDTYKVYKRGSSIRIDLSLLGWSKLKSIRGNSSIVFNGTGAEEGKLLMIDHIKKHSVDILSDVNTLALENKVDELIKHEQMNSEIKADNVVFKPSTTWKGEHVKTNVNGYDCSKFIAKGTFSLLFTKRNVLLDIDAHDFENFEQYFDCILQQPLWILEDNKTGHVDWNQSSFIKVKHYTDSYQAIVKALFEKEGKENVNKNVRPGAKENDKMSISQKKLLKNYTKNIVATIYMCEKFPINLDHLFPVLDILANVSPHINRLKGFLERTISSNKSNFPIKACIPIFFSVNAIISIRGFDFKAPELSLFDVETMIQKRPKKASEFVYRDERFRTEGGSDDDYAQKRWQELVQDDSEQDPEGTPGVIKFEYREEESEDDLELNNEGPQRSHQQLYKSFFNKRESITNKDLVNVFMPEVDEDFDDENLDDLDICEKYRNETLKLSSHGMEAPKTISFLQEKFKSPSHVIKTENNFDRFEMKRDFTSTIGVQSTQHKKSTENIHLLKAKTNYKFLGKLNNDILPEPNGATSRRESLFSKNFNEVDFSENLKEVQMKKLMKYTMKKKNLMSKLNIPKQVYREETHEDDADDQKALEEHPGSKTAKKLKHERIRSLEYPNKTTIENFCNNLVKANNMKKQ